MKNDYIGIDGVELTFELDDARFNQLPEVSELVNDTGRCFGSVKVFRKKAKVAFCFPKYIRENNLMPVTRKDFSILNDMWMCLERQLTMLFGDLSKCRLRNIECNITQKVFGKCTLSRVLDLINRSFAETVNVVYEGASAKCKYMKEKQSLIITVKNCFTLKVYNKTLDARRQGILADEGLLRIEIVMYERIIKRLLGKPPTLRDVLRRESLLLIIEEYKRIFSQVVVEKHIKPCLNDITEILYESLKETGDTVETIAMLREIIDDQEELRKALIKDYIRKGFTPFRAKRNADSKICYLKKYDLPCDVIATVKAFNRLCK